LHLQLALLRNRTVLPLDFVLLLLGAEWHFERSGSMCFVSFAVLALMSHLPIIPAQIIVAVLFIRFEQTKEIEVKKEVYRKIMKRRERSKKVCACSSSVELAILRLCLRRCCLDCGADGGVCIAARDDESAAVS
jgi:hypothetical protein